MKISSCVSNNIKNTARKLFLCLLKKCTTLKMVEIAELSGVRLVATGELIRRFGREIKQSEEFAALLNHSEKLPNE